MHTRARHIADMSTHGRRSHHTHGTHAHGTTSHRMQQSKRLEDTRSTERALVPGKCQPARKSIRHTHLLQRRQPGHDKVQVLQTQPLALRGCDLQQAQSLSLQGQHTQGGMNTVQRVHILRLSTWQARPASLSRPTHYPHTATTHTHNTPNHAPTPAPHTHTSTLNLVHCKQTC